jgi:hypothetical protein
MVYNVSANRFCAVNRCIVCYNVYFFASNLQAIAKVKRTAATADNLFDKLSWRLMSSTSSADGSLSDLISLIRK